MVNFLNTWYAISDIERSLHFYEALGFEERGRVQASDRQLNIALGLPTEAVSRLVLTYREDVKHYDLGNGYSHILLEVRDLDGILERLARAGIHPEQPVFYPGGPASRPQCLFRDPDGYRVGLIGDRGDPPPSPDVEGLKAEEAERRKKALDPDTNSVLPRSAKIGKAGVERLWNERPPRYPMVRHRGRADSPLRVRVRPEEDIGKWLRNGRHNLPKLVKQGSWWWELRFSWLHEITAQLADKYGGVLVIRDEATIEKCADSCVKAESPVTSCKCSCGGLHHGIGALPVGFHVINEALAVRVSDAEEVSITFIKPRNASERRRLGLR